MKKQIYIALAKKYLIIGVTTFLLTTSISFLGSVSVFAQSADSAERTGCINSGGSWNSETLSCETNDGNLNTDCDPPEGESLNRENCGIINLLVIGINVLSALAGMAIVFSIMFAGYQYMTARDNAGQVQKAKQRIIWALVALVLFVFMYSLLNFLIPGGVL